MLSVKDRHLIDELSWITEREANEGALYAMFMFLLLLHPDAPQVLAIDNVDHSLNPRLAVALVDRMQQILLNEPSRPQLLLTTQNPAVLDALDIKDDRVRLFTVTRDRSGATSVDRLAYQGLARPGEKAPEARHRDPQGGDGGLAAGSRRLGDSPASTPRRAAPAARTPPREHRALATSRRPRLLGRRRAVRPCTPH